MHYIQDNKKQFIDKISKLILNGYYNGIFPMSNSRIDDSFFFVNLEPNAIILALLCCLDNLVDFKL